MIQIFGSRSDLHVTSVTSRLEAAGVAFRVLDIYDPCSDGIDIPVSETIDVCLAAGDNDPLLPSVVWWRIKPEFHVATHSIEAFYDQQFTLKEWLAALEYVAERYEDCAWVNSRTANRIGTNKIRQLVLASEFGFNVPRTLFSSNPDRICDFLGSLDKSLCVHKTITPYISPDGKMKYTSIVDTATIRSCLSEVRACPGIFQQFVKSSFELRITVVDSELFVAKVRKSSDEPDWRRDVGADIYSRFVVPSKFQDSLLAFHRRLGLVYAAYDFVVDERGELIFLEVNPAGQWLWLEERLDLPISSSLAQHLANLSRSSIQDTVAST